ncbi:MAG TPA: hypothetical protein VGG68_00865 [Caulobacteraceae bacterium]|jgi:hypothetical protein
MAPDELTIGLRVSPDGAAFEFEGRIVSLFLTQAGHDRVVLESDSGELMICRPQQLQWKGSE